MTPDQLFWYILEGGSAILVLIWLAITFLS